MKAITISHPHFYTTLQEWAAGFDAPPACHQVYGAFAGKEIAGNAAEIVRRSVPSLSAHVSDRFTGRISAG